MILYVCSLSWTVYNCPFSVSSSKLSCLLSQTVLSHCSGTSVLSWKIFFFWWMSPSSFPYFRVTLVHFTLSVILFESDHCLFVFLSICLLCHPFLVLKVHNNLLNRSCLRHVLTTIKKKKCVRRVLISVFDFCPFSSIFGRHFLGNMTPKLNRGCVTFIECFIYF